MKFFLALISFYLFITLSYICRADEGTFVIIPLPFYGPTSGWGLSLKLLHTNSGDTFYFDSLSFATQKKQAGTFNSLGQRSFTFYHRLYWQLGFGGINSTEKYYGAGNHTSCEDKATFRHRSYNVTPKIGLKFMHRVRIFIFYSHREEDLFDLDDPKGLYRSTWQNLYKKDIVENTVGTGFDIAFMNSRIRPRKGFQLSYEYRTSEESILKNDYSYSRSKAVFIFCIPLGAYLSHSSKIEYRKISSSAPFFKTQRIMVRGIGSTVHRDNISFAVQNEERIYLTENWILAPFFDLGKVQQDPSENIFEDLHYGYGMGFRYIVKNALVVRLDAGFSKGGEYEIIFNYGHTF